MNNNQISVDARRFNIAMTELARLLKKDFKDVLKQQAKLLAKDLIKVSFPKSKKQGEKAVKRDLRRAVTPAATSEDMDDALNPITFENPALIKMINQKDLRGFQDYLDKSKSFKGWRIVPFNKELHTGARNKRGQVTNEKKQMTFDIEAYARYQQTLINRVGYMKAGWAKCFRTLGGDKVSPWIKSHNKLVNAKGKVTDNSLTNNPNISILNYTKGISRYKGTYDFALRLRSKKLLKNIQHIVKGRITRFNYNR